MVRLNESRLKTRRLVPALIPLRSKSNERDGGDRDGGSGHDRERAEGEISRAVAQGAAVPRTPFARYAGATRTAVAGPRLDRGRAGWTSPRRGGRCADAHRHFDATFCSCRCRRRTALVNESARFPKRLEAEL